MLSASSRARSTPIRSRSRDQSSAPRRQLPDLRFQPRRRRFLRTQAFFPTRQIRAQRRVLFADRVRVRLQALELAASLFQRLLLIEASLLLLAHQPLALLALRPGTLILARQPLQLQPRHRKPRPGAREFFRQLALLMVQSQRVFFLRLLLMRADAPDPRPAPPCRAPVLRSLRSARRSRAGAASTCPLSSRNSRFSASGPPPVLRPPLTA